MAIKGKNAPEAIPDSSKPPVSPDVSGTLDKNSTADASKVANVKGAGTESTDSKGDKSTDAPKPDSKNSNDNGATDKVADDKGAKDKVAKDKTDSNSETAVKKPKSKKWIVIGIAAAVICGLAVWPLWNYFFVPSGPGEGFVSGNGRVEATEIDISSKLGGRIEDILVAEGEYVKLGQTLVRMNVDVLKAQRDEAIAESNQAIAAVDIAKAQMTARQSDTAAAVATVGQRESELDVANRTIARSEKLTKTGAVSMQEFDDDKARVQTAVAALAGGKAQVAASEAATLAAKSQVDGAGFTVTANLATIARIEADIEDSLIKSPRDGRIQFRVAQPGEVLAAGGKVLNLVDLSEVYLTFFLPETVVGKVAIGSEVHIALDALPEYVIPAEVSYVSSTAQFTPKTVETAIERQKLMFRVKAQINKEQLLKHFKQVKTGLPGMGWLKIDPDVTWPENLKIKVPE
jgi:HlyD family secretion protein